MKLDDWLALTPEQRNAERAAWGRHDSILGGEEPWLSLLEEATRRFKQEYGSHPLVNRISCGGGRIFVTTAQYPLEYLEELPGRYCHFLVEQEPINANRDYYLRYWHLLFENLLGWPEAKTTEWAATWDDELNGRKGSFFYHEDVYYYALPEILVASGIHYQNRPANLERDIQQAIQQGHSQPLWSSPCDWNLIRNRVNTVLAKWHGKLPI